MTPLAEEAFRLEMEVVELDPTLEVVDILENQPLSESAHIAESPEITSEIGKNTELPTEGSWETTTTATEGTIFSRFAKSKVFNQLVY